MEENGKIILCPLIKKKEIAGIIQKALPEYNIAVPFTPVPQRAKIRYILRPLYFVSVPVACAIFFFRPWGLLALVLIPLAVFMGYKSYVFAGWNITGHQLVLRSRFIQARTFYAFKNRIQSLEVSQNWFQRRKSLGSVTASVMQGTGRTVDLDDGDIKEIFRWYSRTRPDVAKTDFPVDGTSNNR